jgi:hypothetical protein
MKHISKGVATCCKHPPQLQPAGLQHRHLMSVVSSPQYVSTHQGNASTQTSQFTNSMFGTSPSAANHLTCSSTLAANHRLVTHHATACGMSLVLMVSPAS